ncbi:MAG: class I SAM-dependent methyltransferase [Bdellovibrio sp.]|nr:class I SAM-dependent methyltransferase [Bdellovibrio sp.]
MAQSDEYWNQFYLKSSFNQGPPRVNAPVPFLVNQLERLSKGKALDIGMGEGINAVYLAKNGFSVKGFDLSQTAIEHALALAKETGVSIETRQVDLDLFLFGLLEYDTVLMSYFKPPLVRYYSEIIRTLKQGGTLLVESFMIDEIKEPIAPDESYRDYYYRPNELLQNLRGLRILFYQEGMVDGKCVVQCLAQKPVDRDAAKYDLFNMQSGPKEIGPTIHQKLAEQLFKKK